MQTANCKLQTATNCRWFHTRSLCLTLMGLIHIFASFPLAFLFYYYVFGIEPFYTLNFLSVYVILAIGADDVFVMVDAWKQFGHHAPMKRIVKAFSRASKVRYVYIDWCGKTKKKAKLEMQYLCIDQPTPRSHYLQLQCAC